MNYLKVNGLDLIVTDEELSSIINQIETLKPFKVNVPNNHIDLSIGASFDSWLVPSTKKPIE